MRIAAVLQRYGDGILGGAEMHAQKILERLHRDYGCEVDVVATTAKDHQTWANEFPEGSTEIAPGFKILRFNSFAPRSRFYLPANTVISAGLTKLQGSPRLSSFTEQVWYALQGVPNGKIFEHLAKTTYDCILFFSYYFYTTLYGLPRVRERSVLIPTAHDETQFHVSQAVTTLLREAQVIVANSVPEKELLLTKVPEAGEKIKIAGLGFDEYFVPLEPRQRGAYFLFLGRASHGKGCGTLIKNFQDFNRTLGQNRFKLVFAGGLEPDLKIPADDPSIIYLGYVSEEQKRELILRAGAVVNLSAFESLSMLVLEAMFSGTPLIVSERCKCLDYYIKICPDSVFPGFTPESFAASAKAVALTDWNSAEGQAKLFKTQAWATGNYGWDKVMKTYAGILGLE